MRKKFNYIFRNRAGNHFPWSWGPFEEKGIMKRKLKALTNKYQIAGHMYDLLVLTIRFTFACAVLIFLIILAIALLLHTCT